MEIYVNGLDLETERPLMAPVDRDALGERLLTTLVAREAEIKGLAFATARSASFRTEFQRERTPDLGDPGAVGWTILVAEQDPHRDELVEALAPLARHRGMSDLEQVLVFPQMVEDDWFDWLQDTYLARGAERPFYVLIAASPEYVPFHFQARLDSASAVGRLDLDTIDDVRAYVDKVIRAERAAEPLTSRDALFFATDAGLDDATYFSRNYLAMPLAARSEQRGFGVRRLLGDEARKDRLLEAAAARPGLVFSASHGIEAGTHATMDEKRRINGAICCQSSPGDSLDDWLLTAADVPTGSSFFEGSIFFQFACFGYGTPAESDFHHWVENGTQINATEDFTAALAKRLVAQPAGPLAVIAHLDLAWLHGFDDPDHPHPIDPYSPRISPFSYALDNLLGGQPVGVAMAEFNQRFDLTNGQLASTVDRLQRGRLTNTPELRAKMADVFVLRSDAQNYMVLGDPAVRLRMLG